MQMTKEQFTRQLMGRIQTKKNKKIQEERNFDNLMRGIAVSRLRKGLKIM